MNFQYAVVCLLAVIVVSALAENNSETSDILTKSNGFFSSKLYNVLSESNENFIISPLSLNYALTLLSFGCGGDTLKELRTMLNQPDDKNAIISSYKNFTETVKDSKILNVTSNVYVDNQFQLNTHFKNDLKEVDAEVDKVELFRKPEDSNATINDFADNIAQNFTTKLLFQGAGSRSIGALEIVKLEFKSAWKYPFPDNFTAKKKFYGIDKEYEVNMMYRPKTLFKYSYDAELNAELLILPYMGGASFLIILPKNITNFKEKIINTNKRINSSLSEFIKLFENTKEQEVEVHLPKFKFENCYRLKQTLEKMDVKNIFSLNANLSILSEKSGIVKDVLHKTFIELTEDQTSSQHISEVSTEDFHFNAASFNSSQTVFNADHPFIYGIVDESKKILYFFGDYSHP